MRCERCVDRNRRRSITTTVACIALLLLVANFGGAQETPTSEPAPRARELAFSETVDDGLLFVDGQFVTPPYVIEATAETIVVNGLEFAPSRPTDRGRFGNSGFGGGFERGREFGERRGFGRTRGGWERWGRSSGNYRVARELAEALNNDFPVVTFRDAPLSILAAASEQALFCETLLADAPSESMLDEFGKLSRSESQNQNWRAWGKEFVPSPELRAIMERRLRDHTESAARNLQQIAAVRRLDRLSYPLTIVAMLIGVLALGHLLRWTTIWADRAKAESPSRESIRPVEIGLLLMIGMSVIDLVWTILAAQAGAMRELNPLASGVVHSPAALVALKATATAVGCGILYAFRGRRQMQHAAWWLCLVCVLLTFRWIVFDSIMAA